jgi:hypothetical protein
MRPVLGNRAHLPISLPFYLTRTAPWRLSVSLEDRVRELEEELKVLKNEIQTTLLDIQEQILVHYYPSLYPSINEEARPKLNPPQPHPERELFIQPHMMQAIPLPNSYFAKYKPQTVTLAEGEEEWQDSNADLPVRDAVERPLIIAKPTKPANTNGHIPPENGLSDEDNAFLDKLIASQEAPANKQPPPASDKISFDEFIKRKPNLPAPATHEANDLSEALMNELLQTGPKTAGDEFPSALVQIFDAQAPKSKPKINTNQINNQAVRLTVRKLLTWVDESVSVIGKDSTKQAIDMYIRAGDLSREMRQALLQLVNSSKSPQPRKIAGIRQVIDNLSELNDILDQHTPDYLNEVLDFITEVNFG